MRHGVHPDRRAAVLQVDVVGHIIAVLVPARDVDAHVVTAQEVRRLDETVKLDPPRFQRILGRRHVRSAVTSPAHRIHAQVDLGGIVQSRDVEAVETLAGLQVEVDGPRRAERGLQFQCRARALRAGVAQIGLERVDVAPLDGVRPTRREQLVFARVDFIEHVQRADIVERSAGDHRNSAHRRRADVGVGRRIATRVPPPRVVVPHDAVFHFVLIERGVVDIEDAVERVAGLELEHRHDAVTGDVARLQRSFARLPRHRVGGLARLRSAPGVGIAPPPCFFLLLLEGRIHAGHADGEADGVVGELVNVRRTGAVTLVAAAVDQLAQRVVLALPTESDPAAVEIQRADRLHVDGTRESLPHQRSIRRLVDGDAVDQFGRVLVQLHAATAAGADLLAAIEQRAAELLGHAADVDHLGASIHALHGQAGQARNGVGDADVRQLADVFGRYHFHDRRGFVLGLDRGRDGGADAGDADGVQRLDALLGGRGLRLLGLRGQRECERQAARHGQLLLAQGMTMRARAHARSGVRVVHMVPLRPWLTALSYRSSNALSTNS